MKICSLSLANFYKTYSAALHPFAEPAIVRTDAVAVVYWKGATIEVVKAPAIGSAVAAVGLHGPFPHISS